jgi:sulfite exporter TauE/SafE
MLSSLALTALLMGLVGGPHCIAMCGAACAGIGQGAGPHANRAMWTFQAGRIVGYSALGAVAAASMQGVGWLTTQSAAIRPVWTLFHVAATVLGLMLLVRAQQPVWLEQAGKSVWRRARGWVGRGGKGAPLMLGTVWALLPCGLLYSALLVAAMSAQAWEGAIVMALFAAGTSVSMMAGPWLWLRLRAPGSGQWGVRLAGLALAASSAWAIWMGLYHDAAPWCLSG